MGAFQHRGGTFDRELEVGQRQEVDEVFRAFARKFRLIRKASSRHRSSAACVPFLSISLLDSDVFSWRSLK